MDSSRTHLVPTPIVNKNGTATTVYRKSQGSTNAAKQIPAPAVIPSPLSNDSSVEQLVGYISNSSEDERSLVRKNIEASNKVDPRFSTKLASLFDNPRTIANVYMQSTLRMMLTKRNFLLAADLNEDREDSPEENTASVTLHAATLVKSAAGVNFPSEYSRNSVIRNCQLGVARLTNADAYTRLDCFTVTTEEANRHFRPIAVAATVFSGDGRALGLGEVFDEEAPSFIAWAAEQENMDELLTIALTRKTISPEEIIAFHEMERATPTPLHGGLI